MCESPTAHATAVVYVATHGKAMPQPVVEQVLQLKPWRRSGCQQFKVMERCLQGLWDLSWSFKPTVLPLPFIYILSAVLFSYVLAWVLELQGLGKVLCAHSINHNMPRFEVLDIPCPWNKVVQLCVSTKVPKCWETHVRFEKPHDKLRKQLACSGCMASSPICFLDYWDLTGTNLKC